MPASGKFLRSVTIITSVAIVTSVMVLLLLLKGGHLLEGWDSNRGRMLRTLEWTYKQNSVWQPRLTFPQFLPYSLCFRHVLKGRYFIAGRGAINHGVLYLIPTGTVFFLGTRQVIMPLGMRCVQDIKLVMLSHLQPGQQDHRDKCHCQRSLDVDSPKAMSCSF